MVKSSAVLLACLLATAVLAAPTVTQGPWTIDAGPGGPATISYNGQPLLRNGSVSGFLPNWAGGRFSLGGGQITTTADSVTWSHQVPGNQDATLTVTAAGNKVTFVMETTVRAAGPVEYSVELVPEAVRTNEKYALVAVNGQARTLDLTGQFANLGGINELRFEQLDRSLVLSGDPLALQDRRDRKGGFFCYYAFDGEGKTVTFTRTFALEVQEVKPEDREARQAILSQLALESANVPVPNGDFEAGLQQWSANPRAAADTEVKHGGRQAARITIPPTQTDATGIYLVQNVPVVGGRLYSVEGFLKTQDVKSAMLGDKSATGGTIILEWADKTGKWLAAGDYAPGLYGTKDWQRVTTKLMRSPKDAGFAIIFLALRATGTVWFDDLKMTEVVHNVVLTGPQFGKPIADNTPPLTWQHADPGAADIELSRDPAFPADKTIRYPNLQHSPFCPDKPLAPGQWYWRVTIPEYGTVSTVWTFTQTAPVTADCTEPVVSPDHAYLTAPRQAVTVHYRDNVAVTRANLTLDGKPVTGQFTPTAVKYTPAADWASGLHRLDVEALDAAGNKTTRRVYLNYAPGVTEKKWLPNGGLAIGGKPQFLLGMYGVRTEDLPEMAKGGYDFVHNYTWDGPGTNESALEYLHACQKFGLQAFIGFDRAKLRAWDEDFVATRVGALSRHPALLAWYLFDEPDLPHQYVPPDQLRALYQLIHTLDPQHPVIVTVAQGNFMPLYHDSYDVYWSMDYGTPAANAKNFEAHKQALRPDVPIMSIVHSYDGQQKGPSLGGDVEQFQPGPVQLRACAFMALAHNSSCLAWWWWGQGSDIFMTVAHAPKAWAALKETVQQIRDLRPVLEAQVTPQMWVEKVGEKGEVQLWEKQLPDRTVLIAVNADKADCDLTFAPRLLPAGATLKTICEPPRELKLTGGKLSDHFTPWAVHVYEYRR